jgi:hypothetical protein
LTKPFDLEILLQELIEIAKNKQPLLHWYSLFQISFLYVD